jgi:hypothetical protein
MENMKITIWERSNKRYGRYEFNHIQNGWIEENKPYGNKEQNQNWANYYWRKIYAYLIDGHVDVNSAQWHLLVNYHRPKGIAKPR